MNLTVQIAVVFIVDHHEIKAVFKRLTGNGHGLLFVHTAPAAFGTTAPSCPPSPSEPVPA